MNSDWLLHYPVWNLDIFAGGFWIAFIATIHVYVAHFAVGGGLFLVLTEIKAYREDSKDILDYTKRHAKFFLLLTAVFGSVTGVGIWFVISVLNPAATSVLVHYFVFGWAAEWAFFLGEVITLFVYFYKFGKMDKKSHLKVGWIYFIFAMVSLILVNGIISFMLTPGEWIKTRNFWDGFFNPTFLSSTLFRSAMAFMLAGLFGFITSLGLEDEDFRGNMLGYCSRWLLISLIFLLIFGWWYLASLPLPPKGMILGNSPETIWYYKAFIRITPVIFLLGLILSRKMPISVQMLMAGILVITGLCYMGSFEWIRESARRPYIISGFIYSNSIRAGDMGKPGNNGILKAARWAKHREITDKNKVEAGKELFMFLCSPCHSINGPINDIIPITKKYSLFGMEAMISGLGAINQYMPPFPGNGREKNALASYIVKELHAKKPEEPAPPLKRDFKIPAFDIETSPYVLLAWNGKGMHCISDIDSYFSFSSPGNDIYAQLIKRDKTPVNITDDIVITYAVQKGFQNPSGQVDFWKFSSFFTGKSIAEDTGLSGKKTWGKMDYDKSLKIFLAKGIPVVPYDNKGKFNPYPLMTIEAKDKNGKLLASTKIPTPVSTEMGCRLCHGGKWRKDKKAGLSPETAKDILRLHDRKNNTSLEKNAENGNPVSCLKCHNEKSKNLNFSAAIHGLHAVYLKKQGKRACAACHPGWPSGSTKAFRGVHSKLGLDCTSCHGFMEDHALSLLLNEKNNGKKAADSLILLISPVSVDNKSEIIPRKPWVNEPDCLNCHMDFNPPENMETFNKWTDSEKALLKNRKGKGGIMCMACHGSPHALYPAGEIAEKCADNIQPMQYQGNPYPMGANKNCRVCHKTDMTKELHHPNSLTMFRN